MPRVVPLAGVTGRFSARAWGTADGWGAGGRRGACVAERCAPCRPAGGCGTAGRPARQDATDARVGSVAGGMALRRAALCGSGGECGLHVPTRRRSSALCRRHGARLDGSRMVLAGACGSAAGDSPVRPFEAGTPAVGPFGRERGADGEAVGEGEGAFFFAGIFFRVIELCTNVGKRVSKRATRGGAASCGAATPGAGALGVVHAVRLVSCDLYPSFFFQSSRTTLR